MGNNMFAYCNNNPVCSIDPTGCFTDGQIHNIVLAAIVVSYVEKGYYYLKQHDTLIYYNGKNWKNGWGYCDLYDSKTGEVWELKKDSKSYTCTTTYAKRQLGKYVNGRLASDPSLQLSRGGFLINGVQTHVVSDSKGTYYIEYWEQGNGILRYRYTYTKNTSTKVLNALSIAGLVIGGGLLGASLIATGGASAPGVAAVTPIIIEWISRAA